MIRVEDYRRSRLGLIYGFSAYLWWGFIALYFRAIGHVRPMEILAHRIFWSAAFLALLLIVQGRLRELKPILRSRRTLLTLFATTILIAINWLVFIYAIDRGNVLEASLGYFATPLINVAMGVILLRERLRPAQIVSVCLAAMGVAWFTIQLNTLPWIALLLALSFSCYGLLRKTTAAGPLAGLCVETTLLIPLALAFIARDASHGWDYSRGTYALLSLSGVITALPLLWFANAARRLRLSTIGFLQYIAPTCQFFLAVIYFREPFSSTKQVTFAFIWSALIVYSVDSLVALRQRRSL